MKSCLLSAAAVMAFPNTAAMAEVSLATTSYSAQGAPGLVFMPSADMAENSELAFTFSQFGETTQGILSFQFTPRLSGSFRFSAIGDYSDRSFDLRYQIFEETRRMPAVTIGANDVFSGGAQSSEYIAATKTILPGLRLTGGLGWGRMGTYQPIGSIGQARTGLSLGSDASSHGAQWFQGDFAPFAGLSYQLSDKVTLKGEYSSDAFQAEVNEGLMAHKSPFNFGIDYKVAPSIHLNAFYLAGDTLGASLTIQTNPRKPASNSGSERAPYTVRPRPERSDTEAWGTDWILDPTNDAGIRKSVSKALIKDGIALKSFALGTHHVALKIDNEKFPSPAQALGRTARILTRALPPSVETMEITLVDNGIALSKATIKRSDIERLENAPAAEIRNKIAITEATTDAVKRSEIVTIENPFSWSLSPYMRLGFSSSDVPVQTDVGVALSADYNVTPNFILSGSLSQSLMDHSSAAASAPAGDIPQVRTQSALYASQSSPTISKLQATWYTKPAPNLYGRVSAGYFESMFGGVSGELLWKPVDSRFAVGAELAWLKQRDFDQLFGFQDYSTVTGHVTGYYDFNNGFYARLGVGRYLAGDVGATLAVDRKFSNGWSIGAYMTKTDLMAQENADPIDTGIRISLPLEWVLGKPTRNAVDASLRSVERDTGARLKLDGQLYDWVNEGHDDVYQARWGKFWR